MSRDADAIIPLYRRHAQAWARMRGTALTEAVWLDRFVSLMPDRRRVLDVGCGHGQPIGAYLISQACDYTGLDASPELIDLARAGWPDAAWHVGDMRCMDLAGRYDGILAWHSFFHLRPVDQRAMFGVFQQHAAPGAALMFTSGTEAGEAIGSFEGEALYHASLDRDEYRALLAAHGFEALRHTVHDPDCGGATVWLARAV